MHFFIKDYRIQVMLCICSLILLVESSCNYDNPAKLEEHSLISYDSRDYQTKTDLRLPFERFWYVFTGGRDPSLNHHYYSVDQKYANDFIIKINNASFHDDDTQNESYHCYKKPIYAPGTGMVVVMVDTFRDNTPVRKLNPDQPAGNYIVIDHGNGEYSFLAHFKKKSIVVKPGDNVKQGEFLGLCGNSGWSFEPHLHYHVQDSPWIFNGVGVARTISMVYQGNPCH